MKKRDILQRYARPGTEAGWHFLTGAAALDRPARPRRRLPVRLRPEAPPVRARRRHRAADARGGKVSRYLFGIEYPPRDLRLGLVEASGDKIGSLVDQVLLYCFHYDPVMGRYSAITLNIVRVAALATVIGLVLFIVLLRRRETAQPGPLGAA